MVQIYNKCVVLQSESGFFVHFLFAAWLENPS